jgi:hypothetical protein
MRTATGRSQRQTRSFSLDREVIEQLEKTKGSESASERANQLLRSALEAEKYARLEEEARQFYGSANDREEARAFRSAAIKSWARE